MLAPATMPVTGGKFKDAPPELVKEAAKKEHEKLIAKAEERNEARRDRAKAEHLRWLHHSASLTSSWVPRLF